ncbi:MAG: hypothetical protein SXA11_04090 [Cyanobacteriota bacterium]|nr:hypothetical protein [Cyanobacteriota bacterium]
MPGKDVGTKLDQNSNKNKGEPYKIVEHLQKNRGKLISEEEIEKEVKVTKSSSFTGAYHRGYVLRVQGDKKKYFYFSPRKEDVPHLKEEFEKVRHKPTAERDKRQNELEQEYAAKCEKASGSKPDAEIKNPVPPSNGSSKIQWQAKIAADKDLVEFLKSTGGQDSEKIKLLEFKIQEKEKMLNQWEQIAI